MSEYLKMKFNLLQLKVDADSFTATPHAAFDSSDAILLYCVHAQNFQANAIRFSNCHAFRIGGPNDEGFYSDGITKINESIYNCDNFPDLEFWEFYEVSGSDLASILALNPGFIRNPNSNRESLEGLKHYLYFMKDATFECFSEDYDEEGWQPISRLEQVPSTYTCERKNE